MILFYSINCQHCSVLLDTIKRHDTKKTIKLVCIDTIVNVIKNKIKSVPALMFLPTKELIYGKAVFDYLLLPNRGYLFTSNSTREKSNDTQNSSMNSPIPLNTQQENPDEPSSFSLGSILTDNYSDINDNNIIIDNTNPNRDTRKLYIDLAKKYKYLVTCIVVNISRDLCEHNNLYRAYKNKMKPIPEIAYRMYFKKYNEPNKEEGIDNIKIVNPLCPVDLDYLKFYY